VSEAENFLSRWARRKNEAGTPSPTLSQETSQPEFMRDASVDGANPGPESPDLEILPSIESITATTDISGFLRSGVAPELTRSALRRAWASDPAIRDFIGIAEGQWDFNAPNTIPGFGLLNGTEDMAALLAQALGQAERVAAAIPGPAIASLDDLPAQAVAEICSPADPATGAANQVLTVQTGVATADPEVRPDHRRHGGALPR
jgi:hypothetical protein